MEIENKYFQIKCDQYWPNRGSEVYGTMLVTLVDVIELASYTIRTFQLSQVTTITTAFAKPSLILRAKCSSLMDQPFVFFVHHPVAWHSMACLVGSV